MQYYHRYVSFWALGRYELCSRDTERNLRLIHFVREHARAERDRLQFDQWRPYVIMMHARSVTTPILEAGDTDGALASIDRGIERIEAFLADYGREDQAAQVNELSFLKRWRREVAGSARKGLPRGPTRLRSRRRRSGRGAPQATRRRDRVGTLRRSR